MYITGRRFEVLENAAASHDPSGGGQIIPYNENEYFQKLDETDMKMIVSDRVM